MISDDILAKIRKNNHITGDQVIVPLFGGKDVSKAWARFFSGKGSFFGFGAKQEFPPYIVLQVEWKPWQRGNEPPQCGTVITGGQDCAAGLQHVKDYLSKAMEYYRSAAHHAGMGEANDEQQFMMDLWSGGISDAFLRGSSCGQDDNDWADMHEDAAYHDLDRALYQQHWALKLLQTLSKDPKCRDAPGWPNPNSIPPVPCTGCECKEYTGFGLSSDAFLCASMGNPFTLGFSHSGICYRKWQPSIRRKCDDNNVCEDVDEGEYESVIDKRFVNLQWRNLVKPAQTVGLAAEEYKKNWIKQRFPERSNICHEA